MMDTSHIQRIQVGARGGYREKPSPWIGPTDTALLVPILPGISSLRDGNRTIGYTAVTKLSSGRLLSKSYSIGARRPAAVLIEAIAERQRHLTVAAIESSHTSGRAKPSLSTALTS